MPPFHVGRFSVSGVSPVSTVVGDRAGDIEGGGKTRRVLALIGIARAADEAQRRGSPDTSLRRTRPGIRPCRPGCADGCPARWLKSKDSSVLSFSFA